MRIILISFIGIALSTTAFAKTPSMKIDCGKAKGYTTQAERQYLTSGGNIYNIQVTYITKRPNDKLVDKALRECINTSLKLDDTKDILATAWFRPVAGMNEYDDEQINPYGGLKYISYTAKTKNVAVHEIDLKKK